MKLPSLLRQALPHLLVIALFIGAISLYFSPMVFKGLMLKQFDTAQWRGGAEEAIKHRKTYGEEPLWSNSMFSGMPAYTISVNYPGELALKVEEFARLHIPYPASIMLISLFCYYILMLALGQTPAAAALGAFVFTFCTFSFVSLEAGHNSKLRAMAMAPLLLAGMVLLYRDKRLFGFALAALGMALQIGAGHYQITYYLAIFCVFAGAGMLVMAVREGKLKVFAIQTFLLVVAVGLGVGATAARLLVMQEYVQYSMRGKMELSPKADAAAKGQTASPKGGGLDKDYVFNWSNEKMESFTLLIPGFKGGSSNEPISKKGEVATYLRANNYDVNGIGGMPLYWGDQPSTSGPVYAGAIVLLLAVLAFFVLPGPYVAWLAGAIMFSIVLTWGKSFSEFNYAMYDYFPAYRQFRAVTMAFVIAQWALPWLGVVALGKFLEQSPDAAATAKKQKGLFLAAGIVGGLALVFGLVPSLAGNFEAATDVQMGNPQLVAAMVEERADMLRSDAFRSFFFILLAAGALFAALKSWVKPQLVVVGLAALALFDLWQIDSRYVNKDNFERNFLDNKFTPSAADERMMKALPYHAYRVLNPSGLTSETKTSYFHQSIGGYSPAKLRRYQDLIEGPLSDNIQAMAGQFELLNKGQTTLDSAFLLTPVLNMLNARYIKLGDKAEEVLENPQACGPAWFVQDIIQVNNPDQEYAALAAPGWNPSVTALIDQSAFKLTTTKIGSAGATVQVKSWKSNEIVYTTANPAAGLLMLSENYYPAGWSASIDGKEASILRADYTLRALEVPAGQHEIIFSFKPGTFFTGNLISTICSLLIYGVLAAALFMAWRAYSKKEKEPALMPKALA